MALTAAASPSSLPQSSTGRFRGQHGAGPLVAAHDDLQQFFGGGERQLAHAEIVEDERGHGDQELHVLFTGAVERGFGEIIEQGVGLAIEHAVSLLDGGLADGLRQVTLAGWAEKQGVFVAGDEGPVARSKTKVGRVRQVVRQTRIRIFAGDTKLPGKTVSVFEPHTEIIRKGKRASPPSLASWSRSRKRKTKS
jgi:hypothetical protein